MRGKTKLYAGVGIRGRDPASFPTRVVFACLSTQSRVQVCPEGPAMSSLDRIWPCLQDNPVALSGAQHVQISTFVRSGNFLCTKKITCI